MDSANCRSKTVFSIYTCKFSEAMDWLYALFYTILYKGLEHSQSLVAARGPGTNPWRFWGTAEVSGESQVTCGFLTVWKKGTTNLCSSRINCSLSLNLPNCLLIILLPLASCSNQESNKVHVFHLIMCLKSFFPVVVTFTCFQNQNYYLSVTSNDLCQNIDA